MGLLDGMLDSDSLRLGLGLLAAGGPTTDPNRTGIGQRLQEGMGSFDAYKANALKQKMLEAQMQEWQQKTAREKMLNDLALKKQAALPSLFTGGQQGLAPLVGDASIGILPSQGRASVSPTLDVQRALAAGYSPDEIAKLDSLRHVGMDEVARTVKGMQNGREVEQQFDKFGRPVGQGMEQYRAPIEMETGAKKMLLDPYTRQPVQSFAMEQSPDSKASNALGWANNQLTRDRDAATNARAQERLDFDKAGGVAAVKPAKQGPMSVTLQKELLESDDTAQSSESIIATLNQAKAINKKAYSGYGAKGRAVLASNMPGSWGGADATIDLDNMMTGQALESLKSVFGGMPTEGERKILLDMQASADKTPEQREAIMDRAIAAAQRRGQFAKKKAGAIRGGTYLTEGVPQTPANDAPNTPNAKPPIPMKGMILDGYKFKGGDASNPVNWEKQ